MRFGSPEFFWAFTALPVFTALYIRLMIVRKNSLTLFGEKHLMARLLPKKAFDFRPLKAVLFLVAYSLLVIALTRPKFGLKMEMVERKGVDVMVGMILGEGRVGCRLDSEYATLGRHGLEHVIGLESTRVPQGPRSRMGNEDGVLTFLNDIEARLIAAV